MSARLFAALELPADVRAGLAAFGRDAAARDRALRPTREDALHLTLAFLGHRALDEIDPAREAVRGVAGSPAPALTLADPLWLAPRRPHVLTVGLGDADGVLAALRARSEHVEFVETDDAESALRDDAVRAALEIREAAVAGDAAGAVEALDRHRLLCAHREGPFGVRRWNAQIERWLGEELGQGIYTEWYAGRPILVTTNDHTLEIYNGETGVAVLDDGRLRAYIAGAGGLKGFAPGRLDAIETMHAMTIHKSQGSQADRVTVLLPEAGSRLLTRELFYTAVTRAQRHVRVVGSEAAVRAAVQTQAQRATGLRQRLLATRAAD
jgi:exodeoxyribonuclease V alpha subunit